MIIMPYMNRKDFSGSRAIANIFRRCTGWGVNDASDMIWCLWLEPRQTKVQIQKRYNQ
jgi:hypothetical protein